MGLIKFAKKTVVGLSDDLEKIDLEFKEVNGKFVIINGDEKVNGSIKNALELAKAHTDTEFGKVKDIPERVTKTENELKILNSDEATEGSIKNVAKGYKESAITEASKQIKTLEDGALKELQASLAILTGDANTKGSIKSEIAKIMGGIPKETLDSIVEIAKFAEDNKTLIGDLKTVTSKAISDAKEELRGGATVSYDTLGKVEKKVLGLGDELREADAKIVKDVEAKLTNYLPKTDNLSSLADKTIARKNLDVYSKSDVNSYVIDTVTGAAPRVKSGDLPADKVIPIKTPYYHVFTGVRISNPDGSNSAMYTVSNDSSGNLIADIPDADFREYERPTYYLQYVKI
jgi:hypothetical protein